MGGEAPMRAPWAKGGIPGPAVPGMPAGGSQHSALRNMSAPGAAGVPPSTFEWRGWSFDAPKGPILATADADT